MQKLLRYKETIFLVSILLLAAYLRLWRISEYMTFLGDEGRDVLVVKRIIVDHKLTLLGPTASVGGFFLGPIYYYFMLPFLWAFRLNPVGPAVMVALFGIATVYLVYRVGQEFFNQATGFFAVTLYTLSPLVIAFSRSSWNPNLVPFFSLLYIYSLYRAVKNNHWCWWLLSGLCIGIGLQLHYLFAFLIPAGIIFLLIYKRNLSDLKFWGLKILGGIIGISPFLVFEIRHRFPNTQTLIRFIFQGKETGFVGQKLKERLFNLLFRLFARLVFYFPSIEQFHWYRKETLSLWRWVVIIIIAVSFLVLIWQLIKKRKATHLLLIFWLAFGLGLFSFYRKAVYDYYFGIMFSFPFLLVGNLLTFFWQKKYLKPLAILIFASLVSLNWSGRPFKFPPNKLMAQVKEISKSIFEKAEDKPMNFALITGQNSDHAYRYFLEIWGNPPLVIENFEKDPERKTVTDQLFVVCEMEPCNPLGHPLWEIAGFGQAEIVDQWQSGLVRVYQLKHWQGENL